MNEVIFHQDVTIEGSLVVKGDLETKKDLIVYGTLTANIIVEQTIYKDKVLNSKMDLIKALFGLK